MAMHFKRNLTMMRRIAKYACATAAIAVLCVSTGSTQSPGASILTNNTPGFIRKAVDAGPADPQSAITVTVWLKLQNGSHLDRLIAQQRQAGSPSYRQWLTQDQFNASFAPTSQEVNAVMNFLAAKGLGVLTVAENNFYIKVQGTIGQIESAFNVQIHNYSLNGATYRSNTGNPSVSGTAGPHIAGITGMDDYGFQPMIVSPSQADGTPFPPIPLSSSPHGTFFESQCFRGVEMHTFNGAGATATYQGNRYGADISNTMLGHLAPCGYSPGEIRTAYGLTPLYKDGFDGAGETIVIVDGFGSATIAQDAEVFSQVYGLPDLTPENFQIFRAPGVVNNPHGPAGNWNIETTLDVEWAHAIAPGAKIALVLGPTNHADLDEAINWAVIHHLGNTISNSWGSIEGFGNPVTLDRVNRILEMAASQGIDVNFSTGDFGDFAATIGFPSVSFPASSPFATGIGGTSLALNTDNSIRFQTGWGNNLTRIANTASEGNSPVIPPLHLGFQGGAGGGPSLTFARPPFQSALPGPGTRLVPDISMVADPFTGVEIIMTVGGQLGVSVIGGTSVACPLFSALMAIAAQKAGHPLGQAAPLVYGLPAGAVTDIVPVGPADNVTGSTTVGTVTKNYSADMLAGPLENTTTYLSAIYNSPFSTRWFVITFGTDSGLTTAVGWDNVTGVGTPNGASFVNAIITP